jgi:ABC-2 type transport system ATP-binding protein
MAENALEIEGLRKTYRRSGGGAAKEALRGIDLTVRAGSIFGLLGPNGAGKSTLINILAGLVIKSAGRVRIWGFDQDANPRQSRAAIGVMPQELNMDPFFTPRGALEVQAGLYGVPKSQRRTDEILSFVGLEAQAGAYTRTLSGGMKRRLLLAKALVHRPAVLVLDEPTAGVDIELRQMLWDNVRRLNAEGTTIILTTHYLQEAEDICDEIAIVNQGRIVAQDRTPDLLARIDTKTLVVTPEAPLAAAPGSAALGLPAAVRTELRPDGRLAFTYRRGDLKVGALLNRLRAEGVAIADLSSEEADLEDVFLALTSSPTAA